MDSNGNNWSIPFTAVSSSEAELFCQNIWIKIFTEFWPWGIQSLMVLNRYKWELLLGWVMTDTWVSFISHPWVNFF